VDTPLFRFFSGLPKGHDILRPVFEQQRRAWEILNFFAETPRTEFAFYRRFEEFPASDAEFLRGFYQTKTRWELFERICLFWGVRHSAQRRGQEETYDGQGQENN